MGSFVVDELLAAVKDVVKKNVDFKDCCQKLQVTLEGLIPTLQEVAYNQLQDDPQTLLKEFYEKLQTGKELVQKCFKVSHLKFWRIYKYANEIERLDQDILKFIQTIGWALSFREIHEISHGKASLGPKFDKFEVKIEEIGDKIGNFENSIPESLQKIMKDRMDQLENGKSASPLSIPKLPDFSVGLEISVRELKKRLLCEGVQLLGVLGMGGSGKTTLATAFCNDKEVQDRFKKKIVYETISRSPNIIEVLGSMWLQLVGENKPNFRDIEDARRQLQNKLCVKEPQTTLVVLDDVWEKGDLDKLMFEVTGYKTLITTRNSQILRPEQRYEKPLLEASDAVSLFCHFAFGQPSIPETADNDLVKKVIAKCDGLPLALDVIGTSLRGLSREAWMTANDKLSQGQPVSDDHEKALTVMATSVDVLKKEVRECFLDMGIFPEARNISADMLLDLGVYVHGLERAGAYTILIELASRNLVKLVNNQKDSLWDSYEWHCELSFTQHDILRELAINLTNKEPITNRRKRLTMPRKAVSFRKMWKKNADCERAFDAEIVSFNTGSMQEKDWCQMDFPNVKALILNFSASEYFLPPFMPSMHKLKVLIIVNHSSKRATLEGVSVLSSLARLKVVRLERVIVPPLQEYCQSWPKLEKLSFILCEGFKDMTALNMGWCLNFPRLLEFTIDHCSDLKELPPSICEMTSLKRLSVTNCHDFHKFLDDIGMLSSLQILRLCGCPSLKEVPDSICKLRQLQFLDISSCYGIKQLPDEIGRLSSLKKLDMRECSHVRQVPGSACHLKPQIQRVICCEQIQGRWSQMIGSGKVEAAEEQFDLDWLDG